MEKHFCDNPECGQEIKFGGAEPQRKLVIAVEFVRVEKDLKAFDIGYGIRTPEVSLGKLFFCGKGCLVKYFTKQLQDANNSIRG